MAVSKKEEFSVRDNRLANFAKALSHPARIAIIRILLKQEACICGDFVNQLPLSQSTVSRHLAELKEAGLIRGETEGVTSCYCLNTDAWLAYRDVFETFFNEEPQLKDRCC